MNEKTLTYLKDSVKYMGFGESLNDALEKNIMEGKKEFTLTLDTEFNKHPFSATLHFRRGDSSEVYFFNKWEATLNNGDSKIQHTFYLNKGTGITLKEGFNLLEGRAVYKELINKEGKNYRAWLQLNLKEKDARGNYKMTQYHENYGYELEKILSPMPIKEFLVSEGKEALLKSLQKGNLQAVSFEQNGVIEKLFIAANPQFKSINAFDHNGASIPINTLEKRFDFVLKQANRDDVDPLGEARKKINGREVSEHTNKEVKENEKEESEKKKEKKQSKSEGLMPKKEKSNDLMKKMKTAHKKGPHL